MNKKEKLLNSLDGLEMSFKKKQEFVNILVGDSENVQGGGSGDEGGGSDWMYFDITASTNKQGVVPFAQMIKAGTSIVPAGYAGTIPIEYITMIGFDCNSTTISEGQSSPMSMVAAMLVGTLRCVQVTKEEFYNLEV